MIDLDSIEKDCPIPESFGSHIGSIIFIAILFFLGFISRFIFAPLMPIIEKEQGLTHSQAGSLFLMISLGFFVAQICSGFLSSRINHRGNLIVSGIGVGVALLIYNFTNSLWVIRGIMIMLGMAAGLHLPSAIATITAMVKREDWGKALSVHQVAPPTSLILGPLVVAFLLQFLPWRDILTSIGIVSIVTTVVFIRYGKHGGFPGEPPRLELIKLVFSHRSYWILILLFSIGIGASVGIYTMLPLYLINEHNLAPGWANMLVGLSQISGLFMTFVSGWVNDKIGTKPTIAAALILAGIATILLGIMPRSWVVVIIFVQTALITSYFPPAFAALARIVHPNLRSVAASITTPAAFLVGGGILPTAIGYMGQNYTFGLGIALTGGLVILGSILVPFLVLRETVEEGC